MTDTNSPFFTLAALALLAASPVAAQSEGPARRSTATAPSMSADVAALRTRAEATGYVETSRYADVVAFVEAVADASDRAHLTTMGYTMEGRAIPLLVVGDVADASPEAVRASGKLRIYLQGGIHSGEVPGKEALQMLAREIALGEHEAWLEGAVLLLAPLYNADGNERVRLDNRRGQHGPVGGMGQRANAMGLDLNRDHMKLDAPEARSLASMMTAYDPHVAVDLHTTNGTRHAYHLTYSPPLHPGTHPAVADVLRDELLPAVTRRAREEHDVLLYYYGNAYDGPEGRGWYTFDHRPRFSNNYAGLRNRLGILGEAYAYSTFRERVRSTKVFVEGILDYAVGHADALAAAVEEADRAPLAGRELPTRATFERSDSAVTILMGDVEAEGNPWTGAPMLRRLDVVRPEEMWEFGTFRGTESEVVPAAYLIPAELTDVLSRLEAHGVRVGSTGQEGVVDVQVFALDSVQAARREFQGRTEKTLFGRWTPASRTVPEGTVLVDVDQPLGRLAFYLLEPRSDDGFANWGVLDRALEEASEYPILRLPPPRRAR
jgi:hypothetical protein